MQIKSRLLRLALPYILASVLAVVPAARADAQTSGTPQRDLHLMGDDPKQRIDLMLAECNVPPGQQSAYLSQIAGMRVDYARLTEPVAQRILASYTQRRKQTTTEETK